MKFTIDRHDKYVIIKPHEKILNGLNAPQIKSEFVVINTDGQRNIVLDLSEVENVDSSGLRSSLIAYHICKARTGILIIACANLMILGLTELSNFSAVLIFLSILT